uniref:diacylglycerol/lipid kinase family protein n=1 Tax=Sphingomonas sp. TaxID=28214 RepID=UPI00289912E1
MRRYWFVTNARSGSTAETVAADIRDTLSAMGHDVAGRTGLPNDDLPSPDALARAGVEWMVVYAGDGTVNTVLTALDAWDGAILILPGGTMNLLARTLHGERDALAILRRLADHPPRHVSLPFAEADGHHAYAGLILGPATRWAAARE